MDVTNRRRIENMQKPSSIVFLEPTMPNFFDITDSAFY